MNDVTYVAIMIGFFVLAGLFVRACDRIIGPDEASEAPPSAAPKDDATPLAA